MRAMFARLLVPASMVCLTVTAFAQDGSGDGDYSSGGAGGGGGAPEINPSLLMAGLVLLVGGTLILVSRRRARHATN